MRCRQCFTDQPPEAFAWKDRAAGRRHTVCRTCVKAYSAGHYAANKDRYSEARTANLVGIKERNRAWLIDYLRFHPCVDCGEPDIDVLEFDHIVPVRGRSRRIWNKVSLGREKLIAEVALCEIRCANCHVRRTRQQFGFRPRE